MDLVEFLNARLDEDEQAAKTMAEHYPAPWDIADRGWMARVVAEEPNFREVTRLEQWPGMPTGEDAPWLGQIIAHIARHDPARVLREVEAKREILDEHERQEAKGPVGGPKCCRCVKEMHGWQEDWSAQEYPCRTLRLLASVYADHPDYQAEWKP